MPRQQAMSGLCQCPTVIGPKCKGATRAELKGDGTDAVGGTGRLLPRDPEGITGEGGSPGRPPGGNAIDIKRRVNNRAAFPREC
jgi:hypothetical protein